MSSFPEDPFRKFKMLSEQMSAMTKRANLYKVNDPLAGYRKHIESTNKHLDAMKNLRPMGIDFEDYGHRRILREIEEYEKQRKWSVVGLPGNVKASDVLPFLNAFSGLKKHEIESVSKYEKLLKSLNPVQDILRSLETIEPLQKYASMMAISVPSRDLRKILTEQQNPWLSTLKEQSSSLSRMLDAVSSIQIAIDSELEINAELADGDFEANSIVDVAVDSFSSMPDARIEDLVEKLGNAFQASSNSKDKSVFATYIFPIILAAIVVILDPIADFYIKKTLEQVNKTTQKTVETSAKVLVPDRSVLDGYRYVSAQSLQVRSNAKIQSRAIGNLTFGQAVLVIEKNKSWALVEWKDSENNLQLQGWVLARYISKFN